MRIGLLLKYLVPTKVAINKPTLIQNCQGFVVGEEKFSLFINSNAAAASKPTTAGLNPVKMLCTNGVCIYFMNILLIRIIKMSEGKMRANVAVAEPNTAMISEYPALWTAV